MSAGIGLYLAVVALVAGTYALPNAYLKWACLALLAAIWLLTPVPERRRRQ